ncbi:MAG: hypothetical protein AMXMBFR64_21940 [Myxococcales bacterium]
MVAAPMQAAADATDLFTAAVGTQLGVSHGTQLDASSDSRFVSELLVHVRLVRVLGLQFNFNAAAESADADTLVFHSRLRLAAQIFVVPLDEVGIYLTGGLGADNFKDLASLTAESNSYQAGLGAEVYIDEHFTIAAEYLMVIPGLRSIQQTVLSHALKEGALTEEGAGETIGTPTSYEASDFISPGNFQATVGLRYYF